MRSPDPITEWSQDEISNWINGLDIGPDRYKDALKYATGMITIICAIQSEFLA